MHNVQYFLAIGAAFAVGAITVTYYLKKKAKNWRKVGTVTELYLHPVKSMRGHLVKSLTCTKKGLCSQTLFDRSFMVIQSDGNMMTARKEPLLVTIRVEIDADNEILHLSAPEMSPIKVPIPKDTNKAIACKVWGENTIGLDCGDEISKWLTDYLKTEYRLVFHAPEVIGRKVAARDKNRRSKFSKIGNIMYHDTTPVHMLSEASLEDLNSRLDKKLTVRSFRPNIVITGCKAYEEDDWINVKIGTSELVYVRDTYRCVLTTVDPDTGIKSNDMNPLTTLRPYRTVEQQDMASFGNSPPFGTGLAVVKEGVISTGDDVFMSD